MASSNAPVRLNRKGRDDVVRVGGQSGRTSHDYSRELALVFVRSRRICPGCRHSREAPTADSELFQRDGVSRSSSIKRRMASVMPSRG